MPAAREPGPFVTALGAQRKFLDLAGRGARELVDVLDAFGDLPHGDLVFVDEMPPQVVDGQAGVVSRHDDGAGAFSDRLVGQSDHGDVRDGRVLQQGLFDFTGTDVEPATDDDVLDPARHPQVTLLVDPAQISCVPPSFGILTCRRELGPAPVLEHSSRTAVSDLAVGSGGGFFPVDVHDSQFHTGYRCTVGRSDAVDGIFGSADRCHHDLAGTVGADHAASRQPVLGFLHEGGRDGGAGSEPEPQP